MLKRMRRAPEPPDSRTHESHLPGGHRALSLPAEWQKVGRRPEEVAVPWARAAGAERSQSGSPEKSWQVGSGPPAAHENAQGHPGVPGPLASRWGPRCLGYCQLKKNGGRYEMVWE